MTTRSHLAIIVLAATTASCATALSDAHVSADTAGGALGRAPRAVRAARVSEPLTIRMSHYMLNEPAQVTAFVRVEPDARSRSLTIEWWTTDDLVGGSHLITLEGERSAAHHSFPIKRMEAGEYTVTAVLVRNDGTRVQKRTRVIVTGEGTKFAVDDLLIRGPS